MYVCITVTATLLECSQVKSQLPHGLDNSLCRRPHHHARLEGRKEKEDKERLLRCDEQASQSRTSFARRLSIFRTLPEYESTDC